MTQQQFTFFAVLMDVAGALCILAGVVVLLRIWRRNTAARASLSWLQADLSRPHFIERLIYRNHRQVGGVLMAAAALWLWLLSSLDQADTWLLLTWQYLSALFQNGVLAWIGAMAIALLALVIGLVLWWRPSMLKPMESVANRWVSVFEPSQPSAPGQHHPGQADPHGWRLGALILIIVGGLLLLLAAMLHPN